MGYVFTALWTFMELSSCLLFCDSFLLRRRSYTFEGIAFLIVWIAMSIYPYIIPDPIVKQILSVLLLIALSALLYKGHAAIYPLIVVVFYLFTAVFDVITACGMSMILSKSLNELFEYQRLYCSIVTFGKLLQVFLAWLVHHLRKAKIQSGLNGQWLLLTLLFPAVSAVILVGVFFQFSTQEDLSAIALIMSGVLVLANIGIIYLIQAIQETARKERDAAILQQKIELQGESFAILENDYKSQRKATHEFKRHLQTLDGLIRNHEYETAKAYITRLQNDRSLRVFQIHSHNPVIDTVLNQKYQQALDSDIRMQVQVNDLHSVEIPSDSLVVLLSNLLDNALEACTAYDGERNIQCKIIYQDSLFVSVSNTSNPVEIKDGEISTHKLDKRNHGFGIPAIRFTLKQLNAEYVFGYESNIFQFSAEIPNPVNS